MIKGFDFAADGRRYTCTVEERRGTSGEFWWWFSVSGDASSYAPFEAKAADTRDSVQERVLAFYRNRVARLAEPRVRGGHWGQRPKPEAAAADEPAKGAAKPTTKSASKPTAKTVSKTVAKPAAKKAAKSPAAATSKAKKPAAKRAAKPSK